MNFDIPEEHQMLRDASAEALARVEPNPASLWPVFQELGLNSICVSEAAGGVGMDALALSVVAEELAYVSPGMAAVFVLHNATVCAALESHRDQADVASILDALISGERVGVGAFGLGDAGRSLWMGEIPHVAICGAQNSDTTLICEVAESAVRDTPCFEGLGWATVSGAPALATLNRPSPSLTPLAAMGLGAVAVGIGRAAFDAAAAYSVERKQFGKPLSQFQAIQWMLSDSNAELDASRLLVRRAAMVIDSGQVSSAPQQSASHAGETALKIADRAIQVHGGYGYTREYPVERLWRDARQLLVGCLDDGRSLRQEIAERTIQEAR